VGAPVNHHEVDDGGRMAEGEQHHAGAGGSGPGARMATPVDALSYLGDLEHDITVTGGLRLHVRPIRPDDGERLMEFHRGLSNEAIRLRFFSAHPVLRPGEVERFTHVDYDARLALVAEVDGELVAVARYDREPQAAEAEVAFVVTDRYQHHGIGALLLDELADAARQRGILRFTAQTMAMNRPMLKVFFDSGFKVASTSELGTVSLRFSIEPDEAYRAARQARRARTTNDAPTGR
jgi:GNAT superfamily N-acetyltransferase